ncbi:lymphocyte-specific protein 1 isoform X2 [Otolemur garnettii]|uniref:lymphocyte-specific protein 1 isoform X2 n=1 Tax=Otolemur garnettii TaxID=30611 RepID=UPI0006440763|nr:lymphocyte-specific protein 1 isoform X2 [Otolemur garnettii]
MAEAPSDPGSEEQEELLGLTTQWSVEDVEDATHEQCRHEHDRQLQAQDEDGSGQSLEQTEQETLLSLEPSEARELEEDEGFGDWSQKSEQRLHWGTEGILSNGEPPRCAIPESKPEGHRPCQNAYGDEEGNGPSLDEAPLEEACLSQEGTGPRETCQDTPGMHQKYQQPRTPSPLSMEETHEQGSPPLSPTTKLIDRTESLSRSIEKSNSVKKSQPALPIAKIDERLEQYTQAVETAGRTPKLVRQTSIELPSMAVASTKNRWETGEVQAQSVAKTPFCKDIVAGDMSKKSLWEQKGGSKTSSTVKSTPSGKRYKFVATGHGKYEKVLVDGGSVP